MTVDVPYILTQLRRIDCPTCKRSRFALFLSYEWYGPNLTCLRCGEAWDEEGRCERPFERAWRKRAVADARRSARERKAVIGKPITWRES